MSAIFRNNIRLKAYNKRVHQAIVATAERHGLKMQDYARQNARWEDRTGNLRQGIFYKVEDQYGKWVKIHLAHTMSYGVFIETSFGGRYAILMETIEALAGELTRTLQGIFN